MKKNIKGFTLIELLVVIAIIGLLSTLAVVSLNNARVKARDARRQSDLKQISTAMELFMSQNDVYPTNNAAGCSAGAADTVAGSDTGGIDNLCELAGAGVTDGTNTFLANMPVDPSLADGRHYHYEGTTATYCISGQLQTNNNYFVCSNGSCFDNGANDCGEL